MSYNVKGHGVLSRRSHIEEVAATIAAVSPDLVGLQEIHRRSPRSLHKDQLEEIGNATGLNVCFGRSFSFGIGEYGNALLTRGTIVGHEVHRLPGKGEPRTLLSARVEIDRLQFDVFVTHLAAWGFLGRRTRREQARVVAEITRRSTFPFILLGDFNTTPRSDELREFHHGGLVVSCFSGPVVTHRSTRQCLDYIFVDPEWRIESAEVLKEGPSDHWPLVARLRRSISPDSAAAQHSTGSVAVANI